MRQLCGIAIINPSFLRLTCTAPQERIFQLQISLLWHKEEVGSPGTLESLCGIEQPVE